MKSCLRMEISHSWPNNGVGTHHTCGKYLTAGGSYFFKYLVAYATLFDLLFSQADIDTSTFYICTVILLGGCMSGCGVETSLFRICIDVIVVRVKVSRGFEPFSPWGSTVRTLQ
jgi:hypothetical protein